MSYFWGNFFRYFFPELCRHCSEKVALENSIFCLDCLSDIRIFTFEDRCAKCGEKALAVCESCQKREMFFSKSQFVYLYEKTAITLLRELKFQNSRRAWELVKNDIDKIFNFGNNCIFLPMPSSRKLALRIGLYLAEKHQAFCLPELFSFRKDKETKKLKLKDRFWHLEKMELANLNLPFGEKYILVDDIYTTGATLNKAAKLLVEKDGIPVEKIQVFALFRREAQRLMPRQ